MFLSDKTLFSYEYPQEFKDIIDIVGEELAYKYARLMGGVDIYIIRWDEDPSKRNEDLNDMVDYFGIKHTREIVARLGCGVYAIPNCKSKHIEEMHDEVVRMWRMGFRHKEISRKHRVTTRTVRNIVRKAKAKALAGQSVLV